MNEENIKVLEALVKNGAKIGQLIMDNHGTMNIENRMGEDEKRSETNNSEEVVPTIDDIMKISKATMDLGFWKCDRSWGVVFQIWQIWGYKGTVSDFVTDINNRKEAKNLAYACTLNAVYKMVSKGRISRNLKQWRADGVLEPYCILGDLVNSELEKEYGKDEIIEEMED